MNDRQRLEAIVEVVGRYLPPDGISQDQAIHEIIGLVDPLPEAEKREWVGLTHNEVLIAGKQHVEGERMLPFSFARAIEAALQRKNT